MAYVEVKCLYCESTEVNRSGKNATGRQRYKCKRLFSILEALLV